MFEMASKTEILWRLLSIMARSSDLDQTLYIPKKLSTFEFDYEQIVIYLKKMIDAKFTRDVKLKRTSIATPLPELYISSGGSVINAPFVSGLSIVGVHDEPSNFSNPINGWHSANTFSSAFFKYSISSLVSLIFENLCIRSK